MTSSSAAEKASPPSWQYIPIAAYQPPTAPVTHSARERLASFRHFFRRGKSEEVPPLKSKDKLLSLPRCQLETLAPSPDWHSSANELNVELSDWLRQENPDQPVIFVVGPPHSGNVETLKVWAEIQSWQTLVGPTPEQILAADNSWLSDQRRDGDGSTWVLPALENVFLRHADGLKLIRRFLDNACSGKIGRGIIACDSWAWAFLRHLWCGRTPTTLTLQAFDEPRLAGYFQRSVDASCGSQLLFQQSDNGHYVLPSTDKENSAGEYSNFLQILAAHSRGNLGVAQAVWRASMQAEPDENLSEVNDKEEHNIPHQTIWILPWGQIKLPSIPDGAGRDEAFVLHTLLLHNGLPLDLLELMLSLSPSQVTETIYRLEECGLVSEDHAVWEITQLGYPAVRHFLQTNSYLVDEF